MKRGIQICKELSITTNTFSKYCNTLGIRLENVNQKVSPEDEIQILTLHKTGSKYYKEKTLDSKPVVTSVQKLPKDFETPNPFSPNAIDLALQHNLFDKRKERQIKFNAQTTETIFTDFEAFSICQGLENGHAKHIARKFFKHKSDAASTFEAHILAMHVFKKYGAKVTAFIIALPPLPFHAIDPVQIFSELDKRKASQEFPILRLSYTNREGRTEKLQLTFYAEKTKQGRIRNDNVLILKNITTSRPILKISRSGTVLPEPEAKQIVPILQLFVRFSRDTKSMIINYGLETGECSICGRELRDKLSIKRGIGPTCFEYIK
jgi:hypothetical protein